MLLQNCRHFRHQSSLTRFVLIPSIYSCPLCTGLLLDEQTILTTAHCKSSSGGFKISQNDAQYSLHSYRIRNYTLHVHPEYDAETHINDLMIIKWERKKLNSSTLHAPKLVYNDDLEGMFWTEGFGGKRTKNFKWALKRKVPLKFKQLWQQPPGYKGENYGVKESALPMLSPGKLGSCFGKKDSGGPTYVQRPDGQKSW